MAKKRWLRFPTKTRTQTHSRKVVIIDEPCRQKERANNDVAAFIMDKYRRVLDTGVGGLLVVYSSQDRNPFMRGSTQKLIKMHGQKNKDGFNSELQIAHIPLVNLNRLIEDALKVRSCFNYLGEINVRA